MDKLTAIKIKYDDGTYSDEIPVSVLSENVEWDSTHTLIDVLGSIDVDVTGTIQDQISQLFNEKVSTSALNNYVVTQLKSDVAQWLDANVNPTGSAVIVDESLNISGAAADAYETGNRITNLNYSIQNTVGYVITGNIFPLTLLNNGTNIRTRNCTVTILNDMYALSATGADAFFGDVGTTYSNVLGYKIPLYADESFIVNISNQNFNSNFLTFYDNFGNQISRTNFKTNELKAVAPSGTNFAVLRFGINPATVGTTYSTKVEIIKTTENNFDTVDTKITKIKSDLWEKYETKQGKNFQFQYSIKNGHTYVVKNESDDGELVLRLRETKDGENLQNIFGLLAGKTRKFIAKCDANFIAGYSAVDQIFSIMDDETKISVLDQYSNNINDISNYIYPTDFFVGGVITNSGDITDNPYYTYTDYISCTKGKIKVISPDGPLNYCCWYNSDRTEYKFFAIPQGETSLLAPNNFTSCRISAPSGNMKNIIIYSDMLFTIEENPYLPKEYIAERATAGSVNISYKLIKNHSYLLFNPNNFVCSFSPVDINGVSQGSTTIPEKSYHMRVSEVDGYANVWFSQDGGKLYIKDMNNEIQYKDIVNLNIDSVNAIMSSKYINSYNPHFLSLIHFSDIHMEMTGLKRLIEFQNNMSEYINDAICTGDITSAKFGDGLDFWDRSEGAEKILTCVGNHDSYYTNSMDQDQMVPMEIVANAYMTPYESNWGTIVRPANCTYYYKDYETGYRLIVLDSIRINQDAETEASWLTQILNDAKEQDLAVIIAMHYMPAGAMHIYNCQFSKYGMEGDSGYICNAPNFAIQEIVQNFIDNGGQFMCYLIGHLHRDIFGYVENYPDQLCIMATTASTTRARNEINSDINRVYGTKSQDAFNVVTFDKDNHLIKVIRVGADIDNMMRPRKAISYNLNTKQFIQQ